jgi:hypothetical protein
MANDPTPTEEYDGRITVILLDDGTDDQEIRCSSFKKAIEVVKENHDSVLDAKIIDRDDDVVFSSAKMDIETWERIWQREKRRMSIEVEAYDCPYDSLSCFADDLCVRCKIDKVQDQF